MTEVARKSPPPPSLPKGGLFNICTISHESIALVLDPISAYANTLGQYLQRMTFNRRLLDVECVEYSENYTEAENTPRKI